MEFLTLDGAVLGGYVFGLKGAGKRVSKGKVEEVSNGRVLFLSFARKKNNPKKEKKLRKKLRKKNFNSQA